ncbi:hypothetical protein CC86DRAFT_198 [Ophiobolus disseminans]|uniref:Uncharacterized protein n=1 Tax=Ophiobolus disseminans TaxID=1469910 RepID=A0A6A7AJE7_9PLEO|nr:hypothetical protein CC86DRAFT_198 [Ophiobolus disseminans]
MAESELNVAIVALVISLTALVVTTQQLLVQIFGSADGYRQCAESVIGSWHKKRKRVWKWSEFRFETQYVTPQIVLLTPFEFEDHWQEHEKVYRITSKSLGKARHKELDDTVHVVYSRKRAQTRSRNSRLEPELEKGSHPWAVPSSKQRVTPRSDTQVTWLRLLRELHVLTHSYWPDECSFCPGLDGAGRSPPHREEAIEIGIDSSKSWALEESSNNSRTEVGIIYRTWNWGFMPAELTRPLAEVSMGDIVILALRMGMQWRVLDLDSGRMQADGNGFNLTGFEARGLGIVLRLTATEQHDQYRRLIPTRAVDKMLLGILPGDPELVGQDFPLVTKDSSVQSLADPRGILAAIMPEEFREIVAKMDSIEVRVDVITLLLTYLPLEGCTMTRYCFPGWNTDPSYRSIYSFWEGRLALHRALRERVESGVSSRDLHEVLSTILGMMDRLEEKYMSDWYVRLDRMRVMRNQMGAANKKECMADAREIYAWTQTWLKAHTFAATNQDLPAYVDLVAAHAYMATHACEQVKEFIAKDARPQDQRTMRQAYNINPRRHGSRFNHEVYEIACHYVKNIRDEDHGIHPYLAYNHTSPSHDASEAAWWVMQLRGIVWHFSTWHPETVVREVLGEQLIPSSFYGNKSPVWIT